jgi:hypothetical protein
MSNSALENIQFIDFASFKNAIKGNHVLFREFGFVSATPHNRASFALKLYETYTQMLHRDGILKISHKIKVISSIKLYSCFKDYISIQEFHSLILLLCFDFPTDIVVNSVK